MKHKVIFEVWRSGGVLLARRWQWREQPNAAFFRTAHWINGHETDVLIVSELEVLTPEECRSLAVKLMTGRFVQYNFNLADEIPKWRKVE